ISRASESPASGSTAVTAATSMDTPLMAPPTFLYGVGRRSSDTAPHWSLGDGMTAGMGWGSGQFPFLASAFPWLSPAWGAASPHDAGLLACPGSPLVSLMSVRSWHAVVTCDASLPPRPAPFIRRGCPSHVAPAA